MFSDYFEALAKKMVTKYANKNIVVIMDNLSSHKSFLIKELVKKYVKIKVLFMPSTTPEFSPIENMFG
jgi:transposase